MTYNQKLNAITRLCIYVGIILYLYSENIYYIILILLALVVIYVVYINSNNNENFETPEDILVKPTVDNPLMNFNIITDNPDKPRASISYEPEMKEEINEKIYRSPYVDNKLFSSTFDLENNKSLERQFYTMPSTTMPNDQKAFAKWCYESGPTCKERTLYCASSNIKDMAKNM